jgi:hypothetical protein
MDEMVIYLTGWLMGVMGREAREAMKLTGVVMESHDRFRVKLASGRELLVSVTLDKEGRPGT